MFGEGYYRHSHFKRLKMPSRTSVATEGLVKNNLAERLRKEILCGTLKPGERIVEGKWASRFEVAQASIREAINILAQAGFVTKAPGRSAQVIHLGESDVAHIYRVRGALEGLAARLAVETRASLSELQGTMDIMRETAGSGDRERLLEYDLLFHLQLCELSGNPCLIEHARRILVPFFAFVAMRVSTSGQSSAAWEKDLEAHQRIIDLLREGEGETAEMYVTKAMERFAKTAYDYWVNRSEHAR